MDGTVSDIYPTKYLSADDVKKLGGKHTTTIDSIGTDIVGNKEKIVANLVGLEKQFVINKTNALQLVKMTGTETFSDWAGTEIELDIIKVKVGNEVKDSITVQKPTTIAKPKPTGEDSSSPSPKEDKPTAQEYAKSLLEEAIVKQTDSETFM